MAPTTTAPTATPIPAIAGAASPPPGEEVADVVVVGFDVVVGLVGKGLLGGGVMSEESVFVDLMGIKLLGMLPVENHSSIYSRLTVDLCVVESQYRINSSSDQVATWQ